MPLWQGVQEMALTLDGPDLPVPSRSVQARPRLGAEPLAHLFGLLTDAWGEPSRCIQSLCACWQSMVWFGLRPTAGTTARCWAVV